MYCDRTKVEDRRGELPTPRCDQPIDKVCLTSAAVMGYMPAPTRCESSD
jgi:hypothetical protein